VSALPLTWVEAQLGEMAETSLGKMLSSKAKLGLNARPYLRNKNVQWGRIDVDDLLEMDFDDDEWEFFRLRDGDLLVCEGGEVGRAAIWRGGSGVAFQKALHRIRPAPGVLPEYLRYAFDWMASTNAFARYVTGSTINHLPQEDLRRLPIPLPPTAEQARIVDALEAHFSRLENLESLIQTLVGRIERRGGRIGALRRATLDQAFNGALLPQDSADEPASILLDRIRSEFEPALVRARRRRVSA
jgi:type I restriction enzyme, S subunit